MGLSRFTNTNQKVKILKDKRDLNGGFVLFDENNNAHVGESTLEISMSDFDKIQTRAKNIAFLKAEKSEQETKLSFATNILQILDNYLAVTNHNITQLSKEQMNFDHEVQPLITSLNDLLDQAASLKKQIQKNVEEIDVLKEKKYVKRFLHAFQPTQYWSELDSIEKQIQNLEPKIAEQKIRLRLLESSILNIQQRLQTPLTQSRLYRQMLDEQWHVLVETDQERPFYKTSIALSYLKMSDLERQIQRLMVKLEAEVLEIFTRSVSRLASVQNTGLFAIKFSQVKQEPIDIEEVMDQLSKKIKQIRCHNTAILNCGYWAEYVLVVLNDVLRGKPYPDREVASATSDEGTYTFCETRLRSIKLENGSYIDIPETELSLVFAIPSSTCAFANLPPTIQSIHDLETTDENQIIDLNTQNVLMTKANVFELSDELKTKAADMPGGIIWGMINLKNATAYPAGHLITFCATKDKVYYIDPHRFDMVTQNAPIFANLSEVYKFSREKDYNKVDSVFFDSVFYLVSNLPPENQNRPGVR